MAGLVPAIPLRRASTSLSEIAGDKPGDDEEGGRMPGNLSFNDLKKAVAAGTIEQLKKNPASITGRFLKNPLKHPAEPRRATTARSPHLRLDDVELHNVRKEDIWIPVGRLGRAEDISRAVLFLVADDADFITGSTLSINGGQHMY